MLVSTCQTDTDYSTCFKGSHASFYHLGLPPYYKIDIPSIKWLYDFLKDTGLERYQQYLDLSLCPRTW